METIKEFLKPNRWKVGIALLVTVLFFALDSVSPINTIIFFLIYPALLLDSFLGGGIADVGLGPQLVIIVVANVYVEVCLIYFIITKIKRLTAKSR